MSQVPFGNIEGATRHMAADQPEYETLPIRDVMVPYAFPAGVSDVQTMTCEFVPTPAQIEALKAGAVLHLSIMGGSWPPVSLDVVAKED